MSIKKPKTVALIPVRIASTRLPRKALVDICGLPMIIHVYKRCQLARNLDEIYVATDSEEVLQVVQKYGGKVILTSSKHETGSDRIAEAARKIDAEIVVNIQGDEALVDPKHIDKAVEAMYADSTLNVAILVNNFYKKNSPSDIKVVLNEKNDVMYFSRADIPSDSRSPNAPMLKAYHVIPFKKSFLLNYASWDKGVLEKIEFNEYLRILEKGYRINAIKVESDALSVDTLDDLIYVREKMKSDSYFNRYKPILE